MRFKFRMYTDENDLFLRDYLIPERFTVGDFQRFLLRDLDYHPDRPAYFAPADEEWIWGKALPADTPLAERNYERLVYCFDPDEERFFYLELTGSEQGEGGAEVLFANGGPPDQAGFTGGGRSIFDEAMNDFDDFEGDDDYYDE